MESETILLFGVSLLFSSICLIDLKHAIDEKTIPAIGAITGLLSTILWFILSFTWTIDASAEMYIAISYLWTSFGFTFLMVTFACVAYILKASVSNKNAKLEIREEPHEPV